MSVKIFRIKGYGWTREADSLESFAASEGVDVCFVEMVEEYPCRLDYILRHLPPEFKSHVSAVAYERGHSAGQEEIDNIAEGMVADLSPVIEAYTTRILKEKS